MALRTHVPTPRKQVKPVPPVISPHVEDYPYAFVWSAYNGALVHANVRLLETLTTSQAKSLLSALRTATEGLEDLLTADEVVVE